MNSKTRPIPGFAWLCASSILLGAFLLFQVQPVISKMILPWFGGSPAVWTTCLLFFQVLLLAGYAYAHLLSRLRNPSRQAIVHAILLLVAVCLLPITPDAAWKPDGSRHPTVAILWLLTAHAGLPYLLLAATSPLIQAWFAGVYADRSPYRLYALSNVGSLGALLSYPVLVEPQLTTNAQGTVWSVLFIGFVALCAVMTWKLARSVSGTALRVAHKTSEDLGGRAKPSVGQRVSWVALPALACVLLMAVTNHLCQSVAVVPLLWIAPLSFYLLSFIICFDREAWYHRYAFSMLAVISVLALSYLAMSSGFNSYFDQRGVGLQWRYWTGHVAVQSGGYLTALFLLCMVCHGELARRKPSPQWLTSFYLSVSAGGALGGLAVALLCPLVFTTFFEMNLAMLAGFLVALAVLVIELQKRRWVTEASGIVRSAFGLVVIAVVAVVAMSQLFMGDREQTLVRVRNFYGIVSIRERDFEDGKYGGVAMFHGDTVHGFQLQTSGQRQTPTSYYTRFSGVGRTLQYFRPDGPIRVGAVGLGTGTIAAYGREGDVYRFYEIDPLVEELGKKWFSFLDESQATIEYQLGDARLSLEKEAGSMEPFDVLVLDAFSGDAIPVHLLTDEAFAVYEQCVKPDGVIAVHISNRHLNLEPVVARAAREHGYQGLTVIRTERVYLAATPSIWILLSRDPEFLGRENIRRDPDGQGITRPLVGADDVPLWTDQYNNLFQTLRRSEASVIHGDSPRW